MHELGGFVRATRAVDRGVTKSSTVPTEVLDLDSLCTVADVPRPHQTSNSSEQPCIVYQSEILGPKQCEGPAGNCRSTLAFAVVHLATQKPGVFLQRTAQSVAVIAPPSGCCRSPTSFVLSIDLRAAGCTVALSWQHSAELSRAGRSSSCTEKTRPHHPRRANKERHYRQCFGLLTCYGLVRMKAFVADLASKEEDKVCTETSEY